MGKVHRWREEGLGKSSVNHSIWGSMREGPLKVTGQVRRVGESKKLRENIVWRWV